MNKNFIIIFLLAIMIFGITANAAVPTFTESIKAKDGTTNKILLTFSNGVNNYMGNSLTSSNFLISGSSGLEISSVAHTVGSRYVTLTMSENINLVGLDELTISCNVGPVFVSIYNGNDVCVQEGTDVYDATIDTTRPKVTSVTVVDSGGNTSISPGDNIYITFDKTMNSNTIMLNNVDTSLGLSNSHTFNASYFTWDINKSIVRIILGSYTSVAHLDTINPIITVTDALGNEDNSTNTTIIDTNFSMLVNITLSNLTQSYTGSYLFPNVTFNPNGNYNYTWVNIPQTNSGSWYINITLLEKNFHGSANGIFSIVDNRSLNLSKIYTECNVNIGTNCVYIYGSDIVILLLTVITFCTVFIVFYILFKEGTH